jgi:hypothetical protein
MCRLRRQLALVIGPLSIFEQRVELLLVEVPGCLSVQSPAVLSPEIFLASAPLVVIAA